jgi:uncharacterized protein YjbI with pentapeptide repeats
MWPFTKPKPTPPGVIIRNVLGQEIDRVEGWNLCGKDLRNRDWRHVDLSNQCLDGSDLSGTNMLGARLVKTSFSRCNLRDAELSFSDATSANFCDATLDGCKLYRSETRLARFHGALISASSDVPGIRVVAA